MYNALIYGFPLILLLFEWGLRILMTVDSVGFTGPTLAAAGLSFLVPLARPKILKTQLEGGKKVILTSPADNQFIALVWILIFIYLFVWSAACFFSVAKGEETILGFRIHLVIGLAAYVLSLLMTYIKGKM